MVVALSDSVATWARQPIETGHPGFCLTPLVIGPEDVPEIRDEATASRLPQLAVLSALSHPGLETADVALTAVQPLPEDQARLYVDLILSALPEAIR